MGNASSTRYPCRGGLKPSPRNNEFLSIHAIIEKKAATEKDAIVSRNERCVSSGWMGRVSRRCGDSIAEHRACYNLFRSIHPDDYRVLSTLLKQKGRFNEGIRVYRYLRRLRKISPSTLILESSKSGKKRVVTLKLKKLGKSNGLPPFDIESLPPSVGCLEGLKELILTRMMSLRTLPKEIGQLQNLETLDLSGSFRLRTLPDEIGNLVNLRDLSLRETTISVLPSSMGQLQNLEALDLSHNEFLTNLPEELGYLVNMKVFDLREAAVKSLPQSFENLANLEILQIIGSRITAFPTCIRGFKKLKYLSYNSVDSSRRARVEFLLALLKDLPLLGHVSASVANGRMFDFEWDTRKLRIPQLCHVISCNRARSRLKDGMDNRGLDELEPKLWPRMLLRAKETFVRDPALVVVTKNFHYECRPLFSFSNAKPDTTTPEAIYNLLSEKRESFLVGIMNNYQ